MIQRTEQGREVRRYLASTIYVTNTAVGPLLLLAAGVALLFVDLGSVAQEMGVPIPAALTRAVDVLKQRAEEKNGS